MYRTGKWITERRVRSLLFLCFFFLTGCASRLTQHFPWWTRPSGWQMQARLEEGNRLFKEGDYSAAEAVFQDLEESENPNVMRPALYGLACSRFMLAGSRQEYLDAADIFERWQQMPSASSASEDPRMLLAFLSKAFPGTPESQADASQTSKAHFLTWLLNCRERIGGLEDQISRLKNEMAAHEKRQGAMKEMEAANKALKETLKAKENALQAMTDALSELRDQIKTFETIDQEIQEKKQGISSP